MNILLVHPVPPGTRHVSALRLWRFGCELACLGHHVALLTRGEEGLGIVNLAEALSAHNWDAPFVLPVIDPPDLDTRSRRRGKLDTAMRMVRDGGFMAQWAHAGRRFGRELEESGFRPDVIMPTFGSMESLFLGRRLSSDLGVPWVLDLKDNWRLYVPFGLRFLMAWRTRGWSAVTANGGVTAACVRRFQRTEPVLIYSGVDECFIEPQPRPEYHEPDWFTVNLIGGLYFDDRLRILLKGVERWASAVGRPCRVDYYGVDNERFEAAASDCLRVASHRNSGYVSTAQLAAACQWSACNAYVAHGGTFHHKLLEMLAAGRPLLVSPVEREESRLLARKVNGMLHEADTAQAVAAALERIAGESRPPEGAVPNLECRQFRWAGQAKAIQRVLRNAVKAG